MTRLALAVPILLLAAPAAAQTAAAPYRALGTEPFWSLTIDARTIRYEPAVGRAISVARPRQVARRDGRSWRTPRLQVDITARRCSDGMSDRIFADTVRVRVDGQVLNGCGGRVLSDGDRELIAGTWRIDLLDGRRVSLARPATIVFDGTRLSGRICNSFGGSYRFARGTLTTGEIVGTQMACTDGRGDVENRLLATLRRPLKVHQDARHDTLVLSDGRSSVTLRRSE